MSDQTLPILNTTGQTTKQFKLPASVSQVKVLPALVHEVVVAYAANQRAGTAHTKTRAEVAGGGKKPWKQKHTGRARHGSIRSPIWVGGGRAHGPRNTRNWQQRMSERARRQARAMVVADYLMTGRVTVMEAFPQANQTKPYAQLFQALKLKGKNLVLLTQAEVAARRGLKNLPQVTVAPLRELNAYEGLRHSRWVISEAGLNELIKFV